MQEILKFHILGPGPNLQQSEWHLQAATFDTATGGK